MKSGRKNQAISQRIRDQAPLICQLLISNDHNELGVDADSSDLFVDQMGFDHRASRLAESAWLHAEKVAPPHCTIWEIDAEAERLLRTGWVPTEDLYEAVYPSLSTIDRRTTT